VSGRSPVQYIGVERRSATIDRRTAILKALWHGARYPRRRNARRGDEARGLVDIYPVSALIAVSALLILCSTDACMTIELISRGAYETNPFMDPLVHGSTWVFTVIKLALTAVSSGILLCVWRFRVFRFLQVSQLVFAIVAAYALLIAYELWLLHLS
jgi:hypothetical protein